MEELLKKYGFRQSTLPNEFTKGKKYKAIVWKSNKVTISQYTPNYGRYLDSKTYESKSELEKELKKKTMLKCYRVGGFVHLPITFCGLAIVILWI